MSTRLHAGAGHASGWDLPLICSPRRRKAGLEMEKMEKTPKEKLPEPRAVRLCSAVVPV